MTAIPRILGRGAAAALLAVALAAGACAHPKHAAAPPAGQRVLQSPQARQSPDVIPRPPGRPPIATSPDIMLQRDGVLAMQRALRERGYEAPLSGMFDQQTRMALLAFQTDQGIAQTSMPDLGTLQRLDLPAEQLYEHL